MDASSLTYPAAVRFDGTFSFLSWKMKVILATLIVAFGGVVASFFPNRDPVSTDKPVFAAQIRKQTEVSRSAELVVAISSDPIRSAEGQTTENDDDFEESTGLVVADAAPLYAGNESSNGMGKQLIESQKVYGEYLQPPKMETTTSKKEPSEVVSVRKPSLRISKTDFEIKSLNSTEKHDPMSRWENSFDEDAPLSKPRPIAKFSTRNLVLGRKSVALISADQIMESQPRLTKLPLTTSPVAKISADSLIGAE